MSGTRQAKRRRAAAAPPPLPKLNTNTKLDDQMTKDFCDLVKRGLPMDGVCDLMGINYTTFWVWMRKGTLYIENNGTDKAQSIYGKFVRLLRRATAEYRLERVDALHKAPGPKWIREMAILERRDRKSFGKKDQPGGSDAEYDADERFL